MHLKNTTADCSAIVFLLLIVQILATVRIGVDVSPAAPDAVDLVAGLPARNWHRTHVIGV